MIEEESAMKKSRQRSGFTLLELIAVMGIIVALSLVVVSGYASIMRSMSEMAGVNALRKAAMLCRQHACIDGRDTYFFLTGFDTYVLCRKAGTISDRKTNTRTGVDLPTYMSDGSASGAIWIFDKYSDLGASSESFSTMTGSEFSEATTGYKGTLLFDLTDSKTAFLKYPPWFDYRTDTWIMGLSDKNPQGGATQGFAKDSQYGWTVYPEQKLPKGYAFVRGVDNFIDEGSFFFKPDGTAASASNLLKISVQELATKKVSSITIHANGKVESDY